MSGIKKKKQKKLSVRVSGLLMALCLVVGVCDGTVGMCDRVVHAEENNNGKLQNGSFEEGQTWTGNYKQPSQNDVPAWNTTATRGTIELFKANDSTYITGVRLEPTDGDIAAELNAEEESTLYQNVKTTPYSIYQWGLDHGARNGTDTMALVIGPKQDINPSKPDINGRDQLMQMVDWLIEQGKTSVKESAGLGEHLVVYSKKFAANGTFKDNAGDNAFSLTPSSIYTEEWHIWIMADSKGIAGTDATNPWGHYGSNAEGTAGNTNGSGNTQIDMDKYYLYTVPAGQTETLFGFVSVGCVGSTVSADKQKTYGNFLDNINFQIYHPLSGSTTLHGSGVVGGSDGTVGGEGTLSTGYKVTVNNNLITYAVDGEPLKVQAVIKKDDVLSGCEFVGLYYTKQDENGDLVTVFLEKSGNEIEDNGSLTDDQKEGKWIKSTDADGNTVYTYYLDNLTSATDLQFIFIKSPTVTYDPNGGKEYRVERSYNTTEEVNVYSFKPDVNGTQYTFISPCVSHIAEGQNDGWKFMGWLLTGDPADDSVGVPQINADKLGALLLPAVHTVACDYSVGGTELESQYFKIWEGNISLTETLNSTGTAVKWEASQDAEASRDAEASPDAGASRGAVYANAHKGLTMVAQWRWRQAFIPQVKDGVEYIDSSAGGTVQITSVTDTSDDNYNAAYNAYGGKSYHAETGEIIIVTATANDNFYFEGWYDKDGNLLTTQTTYRYTETKESVNTYYARFSESMTQTYIRQIEEGDRWTVTTDDSIGILDRYIYTDAVGTTASSTATAKAGYKFVGWYDEDGNKVSDAKTLSYETTEDATYYARFSETVTQTYIRQIEEGDRWTATTDDSIGILNRYTHIDVEGTTASSTATAKAGYKFVGWYDGNGNKVSDAKTLSYTTRGDATYYARFSKTVTQTYIRQINEGDRWVDTTDDSIGILNRYTHIDVEGTTVSSTVTVKEGYEFVGWYDEDGNKVSDATTLSYITREDATYYARFSEIVTQTYICQIKEGDRWVDITDDRIGILDRDTYTDVVGATASSTATAKAGYKFVGWYDGNGNKVSDAATLSYTIREDATYYARFSETVTQTYIRQIKEGDRWTTTTDDSIGILNRYTHIDVEGTTASSTATAKAGYKFVGWYDRNGNKVSDAKTLSYETTGDATYYARFEEIVPVVNVTQTYIRQIKEGDRWVDTTDDSIGILDTYTYTDVVGTTASSTATVKEGYEFVGWYDGDGNKVSDAKTLSYETTEDAIYYARFEEIVPVVNVTQTYIRQIEEGDRWIDTTDDSIGILDRYTYTDVVGTTASSTVTVKEGYEFVGWYDGDGNKVSDAATLSYETTEDAIYYARFEEIVPVVNVTQTYIRQIKEGDNWMDTTDDSIGILDRYTYTDIVGTTASSTATVKEGYEFVGWYDGDGNKVSDAKTLSYETTEDATYYARFEKMIETHTFTQTMTTEDETLQLMSVIIPEYVAGKKIRWISSNPRVAIVNANGEVTVVGEGTCTITATVVNGAYIATCIITVSVPKDEDDDDDNNNNQSQSNNYQKPDEPDKPSNPNQPDNKNDVNETKTGDNSNPTLWTTLILVSMATLAGLFVRRKKHSK